VGGVPRVGGEAVEDEGDDLGPRLHRGGGRGRRHRRHRRSVAGRGGGRSRDGGGRFERPSKDVERLHLLPGAVLEHLEVRGLEVAYGVPLLVTDDDVERDRGGADGKGRDLRRRREEP
jgi:hypothetical protein